MSMMRFFSDDATSGGDAAAAGGKIAGTVKWFDAKKGFGFIQPTDGSGDVFVHHSVIKADGFRSLADGESVEYEVSVDESGRTRAENVTGPDGSYVQGRPQRYNDYDDRGDNRGGFNNQRDDYY